MSADAIQTLASLAAIVGGGATAGGGPAPEDVSPGVIGFLVTLALVLACIPLFRSMTGKLRGVQHRSRVMEDGASGGSAGSPGPEVDADDGASGGLAGSPGPEVDTETGPRSEG